ncbi:hypothetical protein SAMN05421678_1286 [Actinopolymorpha cephalotaxi]|uniref:Lipopolysaccharide export LptBFGC system permease protein LptF n=1 Tax=Actinopolymorpha cephalotaxi TaxID=504797 RepID=A0A1I3C022_9ACTN|nr:hypothetical protein [Actinopolymorpha cephalotaxi]NYH84054.1 lipopolysaccharide export LptBFGC system permease protein LptF [Actinopolymorpha cephalotaxi]SFH67820.1 hypothetical protein SAMN05421678_1286 [Actinopolymorpha cephalotaxi]
MAAESPTGQVRRVGLALCMCLAAFVAVVVGLVWPIAGARGLLVAAGVLGVVFVASWLLARCIVNCDLRPARWS